MLVLGSAPHPKLLLVGVERTKYKAHKRFISGGFQDSLFQNRSICMCGHERALLRVTPGPWPRLWSHSRGPEGGARHIGLISAQHARAPVGYVGIFQQG